MIFIFGILYIPEWCFVPEEFPLLLFRKDSSLDLFGNVLGIHVSKQIAERSYIHSRGIYRINIITYSDISHIVLIEIYLHKIAGLKMISAQTGLVFGYNAVDLAVLDVLYHSFECGTLKVRTAVTVIHLIIMDDDTVLGAEPRKYVPLVLNGRTVPVGKPVVLRKSAIESCVV